MAHKTFISYKWSEAQDLRDEIIETLREDATYYKGETSDSPDLTDTSTENIKKNLKDMMYIFLSHSHDDEEMVKQLAGYLKHTYGIECFIDSCVWGYANDLLKEIDNKYCRYQETDGQFFYEYDNRNRSTSHVHMLLNGALAKMINKTECLFFVNTPNSVNAQDAENPSKTASPWIYSELLMATEFPHEKLSKYREGESYEERGYFEHAELQINYDIKIDKLTELYFSDLKKMKFKDETQDPLRSLDTLYRKKGLI